MVTTNSVVRNILRYSILGLLLFLVLLVASHGDKSAAQFILTTLLILIIVSLFEAFAINNPVNVVTVENIAPETVEKMTNVRGETFLRMNKPVISDYGPIITLPSNENGDDVPYDMRGLMIKKNNNQVPEDIDYIDDMNTNFMPNELQISGDKFDYLQRGHIYDDYPGETDTDDLILSPNFGRQGYFMQNECNF